MITREIVDAYEHVGDDDTEWWMIVTASPDGTRHVYALPACTFENLSVEYGLDPGDIDELLRIAILQLHIPHPMQRANAANDAAALAGLVRNNRPVTFGNADSTGQAREAHLARIAWVEAHEVRILWPSPAARPTSRALDVDPGQDAVVDPHERLAALKATYRPDKERMAATRDHLSMLLGRPV
ncbi:hypothetical protein [Nonomuraea lactucae]|uniref:hypothetical protein n=1 Tax=Nonomuraea lactucae TaxID=2249762 RepID=UPI000DE4D705|nr:hypothetical protein [Nonomuraea lactucae]